MFSLIIKLLCKFFQVYLRKSKNKENEYKKILFYALKEQGGVYIKFLQVLCVMHDFMNGWSGPKELEVFNKVSIEDIDLKEYIDNFDKFDYIESYPFASGSFAQIYKGKLLTGEVVAIKILKPSVVKTLKKDLKSLKYIVDIFSAFLPSGVVNYKSAFDELSKICLLEIDYEREVSNIRYFSEMYKNNQSIIIPKVYSEFCRNNIIVLEYIDGITLSDAMARCNNDFSLEEVVYQLTGSDIWTQIMIVGGEFLRTAMMEKFVYGDPHPGNIILLSDNKIGLVDFGIIVNKPISQEAFYKWTKSYFNILNGSSDYSDLLKNTYICFCPDLTNAFRKYFKTSDVTKYITEAITKKSSVLYNDDKVIQKLIENGHLIKVFSNFMNKNNSLNIKLDERNIGLLKAMQAFLCSVTTIDNKNGADKFAKLMVGSMKYALYFADKDGINNDYVYDTKYSVNDSYGLLVDTLTTLAEGDEFLFQNIIERMVL